MDARMKLICSTGIFIFFNICSMVFNSYPALGNDFETCIIHDIPKDFDQFPAQVHQALVVKAHENSFQGQVTAWEKTSGQWAIINGPFDAVVGRNGVALKGEKREGDGRTPAGVFVLKRAFGYEPSINTGLDYRQVTDKDFWIDEPSSPEYNQWITGDKPSVSHEVLRRNDDLYKYAAVIEYNTSPVVAGMGSAIFLHVWKGKDKPTSGCVAMSEQDVLSVLAWLDMNRNPIIVIQ